ncbi:hypothetical protein [Paenibacillus sp. cl130]|uniref:hypothetical protein n=1 Tax=Paenibacillus sp. cl130 TaxID=1761876 RepID=UPI0008E6B10A|nr:hypothetical protein [Paenibacillus sp. cl130]SFR26381.1 hypothetical protein SAMN04488603_111108 [Paenibacillus sp. cl130]
MNGTQIANTTVANPNLEWSREFNFSNYASSDNAVLIVLNADTLFTYFESAYSSGNPPYHSSSFVDTSAELRRDAWILLIWLRDPDILVYDLDTKKVIDFVSNLNYNYAKGIEPQPTVVYYN